MKVTFIGHASILIESEGVSILSDPWWNGPCFGAQWWIYPNPFVSAVNAAKIDYIYVSHGHHDHFHPSTLSSFARETKILVSSAIDLADPIRAMGFEVITVDDGQALRLNAGNVVCRIMKTHGTDTLMAVSDGSEVCLNLNDALHSAPSALQREFVARLRGLYPQITYAFCGYGVASHFPNCYVLPGKDREATAARRQMYFNRQWAALIEELRPTFGFPFAADVVFLESDLLWVNSVTHNAERPTTAFAAAHPASDTRTIDIAPGFVIEDGVPVCNVTRQELVPSRLLDERQSESVRANRYGSAGSETVDRVVELLHQKKRVCEDYLRSYPGDYRIGIRLRNADVGIQIQKHQRSVSIQVVKAETLAECDLIYTTRLHYLKRALTEPYGDEILFVGSGGIFEYLPGRKGRRDAHLELMQLIRTGTEPPKPRYGGRSRATYRLRSWIKKLLFGEPAGLYDLNEWTEFSARSAPT